MEDQQKEKDKTPQNPENQEQDQFQNDKVLQNSQISTINEDQKNQVEENEKKLQNPEEISLQSEQLQKYNHQENDKDKKNLPQEIQQQKPKGKRKGKKKKKKQNIPPIQEENSQEELDSDDEVEDNEIVSDNQLASEQDLDNITQNVNENIEKQNREQKEQQQENGKVQIINNENLNNQQKEENISQNNTQQIEDNQGEQNILNNCNNIIQNDTQLQKNSEQNIKTEVNQNTVQQDEQNSSLQKQASNTSNNQQNEKDIEQIQNEIQTQKNQQNQENKFIQNLEKENSSENNDPKIQQKEKDKMAEKVEENSIKNEEVQQNQDDDTIQKQKQILDQDQNQDINGKLEQDQNQQQNVEIVKNEKEQEKENSIPIIIDEAQVQEVSFKAEQQEQNHDQDQKKEQQDQKQNQDIDQNQNQVLDQNLDQNQQLNSSRQQQNQLLKTGEQIEEKNEHQTGQNSVFISRQDQISEKNQQNNEYVANMQSLEKNQVENQFENENIGDLLQSQNHDLTKSQDSKEYTFSLGNQKQQNQQIYDRTGNFQQQKDEEAQNNEIQEDFQPFFNNQIAQTKKIVMDLIEIGDLEALKQIIKQFSFQPNEELSDEGSGQTALHFACFFQQPHILEFIIFYIYKKFPQHFQQVINLQTKKGNTPLMVSVEKINVEIFDILLKYGGVDFAIKNNEGQNVLDLAKKLKEQNENKENTEGITYIIKTLERFIKIQEQLPPNIFELEKNGPETLEILLQVNKSKGILNNLTQSGNFNKSQSGSYRKDKNLNKRNQSAQSSLQKEKITQYMKQKQNIEQQLHKLNDEIGNLQGSEHKSKSPLAYKKRLESYYDQEAQKSAQNLVYKMNLMRKEKELKYKEKRLQMSEKIHNDMLLSQDRNLQIKRKLVEQKHEQILKKLEKQRQEREEQMKFNQKANELVKKLQQHKSKEHFEKNYQKNIEMPELEKRKQKLAEKRKMFQPLSHDQFQEHKKKHQENLKIKLLENKKERMFKGQELPLERNSNYKPIKSSYTSKVLQYDKEKREREKLLQEEKKQMMERRKKYGQLVKDIYQPQLQMQSQLYAEDNDDNQSVQKTPVNKNLENKKSKPKMFRYYLKKKPVSQRENQYDEQQQEDSGGENDYIKQNRKYKQLSQNQNQNLNSPEFNDFASDSQIEQGVNYYKQQDITQKSFNSNSSLPKKIQNQSKASSLYNGQHIKENSSVIKLQKNPKDINYLQELRRQRNQQEQFQQSQISENQSGMGGQNLVYKQENWNKIIDNDAIEMNEKYQKVLASAQRIENLAKRKEINQQFQNSDTENIESINNLYIDSIKAKLALLDKIKDNQK
ncbi:Ankyrin repeat-containing domain [Pseudocohnilembus persalinus]|uniref:Ankyrin repeat-containing domain n=1 Tax=Pseudocohnilembus persalinus TaxID=266149 RepID=A0A0V0QND5_PSEPJ|nr:Ankyrin repeat-containing domain [Pseudocohnilembus persalinus]|eukprot:KRX03601.1 Ankyrin repeat-containing domain [Pseudocohnilembus persalinus]